MRIPENILRMLVVHSVSRCLTGNVKDLKKLFVLDKIPYPSPVFRSFLRRLRSDMEHETGLANLLVQLGKNANPACRQKLVENLIFNWVVKGARLRTQHRAQGHWVPFFVVISPTMRCNLNCTGCYSGLYSKDGELSEHELDDILCQCKEIGNYFVVFSGGEPYMLRNRLLRLFAKHDDMFFLTFTNGTHLDEPLVGELAHMGNVAPGISIEGYQNETDQRRGRRVYQKALKAIDLLNKYGVMFGISVTYTRDNVDLVTDEKFVEFYVNKGAIFGWYFMFMPIGKDPVLRMVPTPEQRIRCGERVSQLRKQYPMFMADFWNDGPAVGGCLAGARRYLHILNSGRVEPCVFAHFGVDNIREKPLLEACNSPFFTAIRREFPYNAIGNLKRPCMIIDNPGVLRRLVEEHVVPAGHEHSEDIIRDPEVAQWIDDYAQHFQQLSDPAWLKMIEDPESRWFKEKPEFKNLFRFRGVEQPLTPQRDVRKVEKQYW
jgi:MoaA/NifB/PqqE/SkfB family radical SAM enzyme